MSAFKVKYPGKRCPHCKKAIEVGQFAEFCRITWPYGSDIACNPRDMVMWHQTCLNSKLVAELCEACGMLHSSPKEKGMCLI